MTVRQPSFINPSWKFAVATQSIGPLEYVYMWNGIYQLGRTLALRKALPPETVGLTANVQTQRATHVQFVADSRNLLWLLGMTKRR
jgi:hypothetical protein